MAFKEKFTEGQQKKTDHNEIKMTTDYVRC